jgi:hypothetical protein
LANAIVLSSKPYIFVVDNITELAKIQAWWDRKLINPGLSGWQGDNRPVDILADKANW